MIFKSNNFRKTGGIKGSSSYKATIDIGHRHNLFHILRFYRSTVLNDCFVGNFMSVSLGNNGTNEGMDLKKIKRYKLINVRKNEKEKS